MTVRFTATDSSTVEDGEVLVASVSCAMPSQRLTLQRSLPADQDEWGVYLEYNGQHNSAYDNVSTCTLGRERLTVQLRDPIGHGPRYIGFEIALRIDAVKWTAFAVGLQKVFAGVEDTLNVNDSTQSLTSLPPR